MVRQLRRHRQPEPDRRRLQQVQRHRAADPRLPNGGGYTVGRIYNINPNKVTVPQNNYFTLASNYGEQIQHWNGFDLTINARFRRGFTVQGGVSSGRHGDRQLRGCRDAAGSGAARDAVLHAVLPPEGKLPDRR